MSRKKKLREKVRRLAMDNVILRALLQEARGSGACGVRMHGVFPGCGHKSLHPDCLWCAREDARRCAFFENVKAVERDDLREFLHAKGIGYAEFEQWCADSGRAGIMESLIREEEERRS